MPKHTQEKTVLAFDFGLRRIGVAIGQTITKSSRPLTVLHATDGIPQWEEVKSLISTWDVTQLVVGLPFNTDGSEQEITLAAKKFSRRLQAKYRLPVALIDERYSTKAAKSSLTFRSTKNASIDSHAAAVILDSWLHENG